jgi:hypothetical protein
MLPGTDYRFTVARGLFDQQLTANNGQPNRYGIDPVQFFVQGYCPDVAQGLEVKLGRFYAPVGFESIEAPQNLLVSHSYSFIYDPFTQTGLLGNLKLSEAWSVHSGIVAGNDVFLDPASTPTYSGGFDWTSSSGNTKISPSVILGSGRFNRGQNFTSPNIFDLVVTQKLTDEVTYNLHAIGGYTTDVPQIGLASWFGIVNYLSRPFNKKLSGATRLEFFDDLQGQRTGTPGLYTDLAGALTYQPTAYLILRPELRFDYQPHRPFEGHAALFTATADVIVRW